MTATTSTTLSARVNCTSSTEARTVSVRSLTTFTSTPWGKAVYKRGSSAFTRSATSMTLAPGWRRTLTMMARFPSDQPASSSFSTPSMTLATSCRRMGAPLL